MIVSDIVTRVNRQFGDESGVQVTNADIIRWINDGMRQIVLQNEGLLEATPALTSTVNGQQDYTLPTDLLILKAVSIKYSGAVSYTRLDGLSFPQFNEYLDGWEGDTTAPGTPVAWTETSGNLRLWPVPDANVTNALKIYYQRKPIDVDDVNDSIDLPLLYHDGVVKYCLQQAYKMDEDLDAASAEAASLDADLQLLRGRQDWKKQDTYPTITVLYEDL